MSYGLTTWGWLMMLLSVGSITWLTVWCFWRVLTKKGAVEVLHDPREIDTHDGDA